MIKKILIENAPLQTLLTEEEEKKRKVQRGKKFRKKKEKSSKGKKIQKKKSPQRSNFYYCLHFTPLWIALDAWQSELLNRHLQFLQFDQLGISVYLRVTTLFLFFKNGKLGQKDHLMIPQADHTPEGV
jgi:hypothetical protein